MFTRLRRSGTDETVVSFRDLPQCLAAGADEAEALAEAADALEEAVAGRISHPSAHRTVPRAPSLAWSRPLPTPIKQRLSA